jgi:hypothetical protein
MVQTLLDCLLLPVTNSPVADVEAYRHLEASVYHPTVGQDRTATHANIHEQSET